MFSPSSWFWHVNREWLIALAGPRAVMLELAHPQVAAGVEQHSNYHGDPFGRLYRTMRTMTELTFGTPEEASTALRHFYACHTRVKGRIAESNEREQESGGEVESKRVGRTGGSEEMWYDATDPELKLWVWATLVDSVVRIYDRFVTPLAYSDRCGYYDDTVCLARLLGIPGAILPGTYTAFNLYMGRMLGDNTLHVTRAARAVVDALYAPFLVGGMTRAFSFASIGMLPPRLLTAYGFSWDERRERQLEDLAVWSRRVRPWIPPRAAIHPKARRMEQLYQAGAAGKGSI